MYALSGVNSGGIKKSRIDGVHPNDLSYLKSLMEYTSLVMRDIEVYSILDSKISEVIPFGS